MPPRKVLQRAGRAVLGARQDRTAAKAKAMTSSTRNSRKWIMAVNSRDRHHGHHHKSHASEEVDESATAKPIIQGEGDEARSGLDRASHQPVSGDHDATASSKGNAKSTQLPAEEKIAELQATVADLEDKLKRALADQENSRKRTERDADTAVKFSASALPNHLLPPLDHFPF